LWGPAQTESIAGHLHYISFTDDFSQETKVCFLKLKSKALSALKDYETELRCHTPGAKIKKVRSDRGGEYLSMEFDGVMFHKCLTPKSVTIRSYKQQK
jgi:hypothetical protein